MKRILFMVAMACLLIGGTVVYGLADSNQAKQQADDSTYSETTGQGMMGQHMMSSGQMGQHMMGNHDMDMYDAPCWGDSDENAMSHRMGMMNQGMMNHMMGSRHMEGAMMGPYAMGGPMSGMKENIQSASELTIARMDLNDLLSTDNWSLKDAETLTRKIQKMEADLQVRQFKAAIDARKVLTPQQLAQVKTIDESYDHDCHFG